MNWKFWKKGDDEQKDETTIKVSTGVPALRTEIYVCAQTADKAYELYKKLREE